jgi:iron complex transport system ATP-binding protein
MQIPLREIAKEVAILPQILNIPFSFTVWEIVSMGRFPHNGQKARDKEVVENAMRTMDILRLQSRRVSELSGGERQRVLLAQALAQTPKLLLLDEPTAQLDIGHKVEILEVVRRLNREEGLTVLMNLHDLNLASEYCSNLVLLNQGKIEKTGRPEEILTAEIIEKVYKAGVLIDKNPVSGKPHIFPNVRS